MNRLLTRSLLTRASSVATSVVNGGANSGGRIVVTVQPEFFNFSACHTASFYRTFSSASSPPPPSRKKSTKAVDAAEREGKKKITAVDEKTVKEGNNSAVTSYWAVSRPEITTDDGSKWRWNCFMPWDTYEADLSIDLSKHHKPTTILDKIAYRTVKLLRLPTDIFFQRRYGCRAMMLETVAAVPGMVGGMLLHLKSLRRFEQSGGWIKALLEEAENERMHLMTMVELVKPKWYERLLVITVQGVFFNVYFALYLMSPKIAHRVVGYLEEEAIHSYTEYLKDIESGAIENVAAPAIAIDYWRLPKDATLKDVITVIRADEAHHRDVNHFASDVHLTNTSNTIFDVVAMDDHVYVVYDNGGILEC